MVNIVEPKERVAVGSGEQFHRLYALERMVNATVDGKPLHKEKRSQRAIPSTRRITSCLQRSAVPDSFGVL